MDDIHRAIQNNEQISFQYLEWNLDKELVPRKDGKIYRASPWALTCKDENYYLIAHDGDSNAIKHFRVDKMGHIKVLTGVMREGAELFDRFDIAAYANKTFGMFGGREEIITLEFENRFIGVVMDRFGKEVPIRKRDENHFSFIFLIRHFSLLSIDDIVLSPVAWRSINFHPPCDKMGR